MSDKVKAAILKMDYGLYPRQKINDTNRNEIEEAMRAGVDMPPIIVDRKSKRIIDGFHRIEAAKRVFGETAEVKVEWRDYKNDAEMFEDSVRLNACHGQKLSQWDRNHCIEKAREFGIDEARMATILNVRIKRIEHIQETRIAEYHEQRIPLKRTIVNLAKQKLTERQFKANEKAGGHAQLYYVNQVINLIENDALDLSNENLLKGLEKLFCLLESLHLAGAA